MSDEANVLQVAFEILGYMKRHPEAADTGEHIKNWWLQGVQEVEYKRETVTRALQMLENNEFIEHVELPDKRMAYRLRKRPQKQNQGTQ